MVKLTVSTSSFGARVWVGRGVGAGVTVAAGVGDDVTVAVGVGAGDRLGVGGAGCAGGAQLASNRVVITTKTSTVPVRDGALLMFLPSPAAALDAKGRYSLVPDSTRGSGEIDLSRR
jgi:hypothetical protein